MRYTLCLVAIAVLTLGLTHAQPASDPTSKEGVSKTEPTKSKRFLYLVRYGAAQDLAAALSQHFKDEEGFQIVPEAIANGLLITASPAVSEELVKLLDQLDRRPRQVMIDVLIAEVPLQGEEHGFDPADFNGTSDTIMTKTETLARKAKLNHLRRFQISALENQAGSITIGENKPHVTGANMGGGFGGRGGGGGGGPAQFSVAYQALGSVISATPRIGADGMVTVDLKLEESRMSTPEEGIAIANGVNAAEMLKTSFAGKVSVASGKAVLAQGVKTESKNQKTQTIVVVAAKVIEK